MGYTFDSSVIFDNLPELLYGCLLTMELSIAGMAIALIIVVLAVLALRSRPRLFGFPIQVFVEVVRNTPFLIQIFFIYFGLPAAGIRFDPNVAAVIALAINGAAYAIEIIRSGVDAVAKGQIEAGYALGLRPVQIFRYMVWPALRSMYSGPGQPIYFPHADVEHRLVHQRTGIDPRSGSARGHHVPKL